MDAAGAQSAGTTRYLLDGLSVIAQYAPDGQRQAWYTQSLARIDEVLNVANESGKFWYQADALGSVYGLTNQAGALIGTQNYDVFGAPTPAPSGPAGQPFGYTGREHELDSGLVYARARYLNPSTGRWDRPDPLGLVPSVNVYSYLDGSPTVATDPHGLYPFWVHDYIIDSAFPQMFSEYRQILHEAQWDADFGEGGTSAALSFKHAMRCSGETQEHALNAWWGFVVGQLVEGIRALRDRAPGPTTPENARPALREVGLGMHAVQDLSAPQHTGFQVWKSVGNGLGHISKEVGVSPLRTPDVVVAMENSKTYYRAFLTLMRWPVVDEGAAIAALGGKELYYQAMWTIVRDE